MPFLLLIATAAHSLDTQVIPDSDLLGERVPMTSDDEGVLPRLL
jgi:hypothetical protein